LPCHAIVIFILLPLFIALFSFSPLLSFHFHFSPAADAPLFHYFDAATPFSSAFAAFAAAPMPRLRRCAPRFSLFFISMISPFHDIADYFHFIYFHSD
jgi:hypothetical protein